MQRLQVGLVGLIVVLVFVSLANMALDRANNAPATTDAAAIQPSPTTDGANKDAPAEPMAELGVAPVSKDADTARPASGAGQTTTPHQR